VLASIRKHPLLTVLILAVVLRGLAVVFSKGYMVSDDYWETVRVAYNWLIHGLWSSPEHLLTWRDPVTRTIARFPLYHLGVLVVMKIYAAFHIYALNDIMYGVRAAHAAVSLISVWCVFKIVEMVTKSRSWALIAGLVIAAHAAMPFLSVRNLIEMVGGHFWILALYLLYRNHSSYRHKTLLLAGLVTGLAWMIRFEIAFAALPVPFVLWYERKSIRPALVYSLGVVVMLLLSGFVDWWMLGSFAASTINHISQVLTEPPPYQTPRYIYLPVIFGFFLPPLSLIAVPLAFVRSFWTRHKILAFSCLVFIIAHTLSPSRQERYIIPIIPAMFTLLTLAVHHHWSHHGFWFRHRRAFMAVVAATVIINLVVLIPLTFNYSRKGRVEPFVRIEEQGTPASAGVVVLTPQQGGQYPLDYAGTPRIRHAMVYRWSELSPVAERNEKHPYRYFVLYPPRSEDLSAYVDSIETYFGPIKELYHSSPSTVDYVLHFLNPKHNRTNEAWLYRASN
jgi:hypothetical protein